MQTKLRVENILILRHTIRRCIADTNAIFCKTLETIMTNCA